VISCKHALFIAYSSFKFIHTLVLLEYIRVKKKPGFPFGENLAESKKTTLYYGTNTGTGLIPAPTPFEVPAEPKAFDLIASKVALPNLFMARAK
jgi:hypothetical protein